jgi:hypothetical protein
MPSSEVMHKWKKGKLHSGSKKGKKVKSHKQAVAIMLSEKHNEDKHGGKYKHKNRAKHDQMLRKMQG